MKIRYQVLYDGKDKSTPTRNFSDTEKAAAQAFFKAEKKAGKKVSFWDVLNNPLSKFFTL